MFCLELFARTAIRRFWEQRFLSMPRSAETTMGLQDVILILGGTECNNGTTQL